MPVLPQPVRPNFEEALDFLAYLLATDPRTAEIAWIIGDVGMGAPQQTPFGYISPRNDQVAWMTAAGQTGGLPTGRTPGLDQHVMLVPLTVAVQPHAYLKPVVAAPPQLSPLSEAALNEPPPFFEQPGYRVAMGIQDKITQVLREEITLGGELATSNIIETAYLLQEIEGKPFRALRMTLQLQQRRRRDS